MAPHFDADGNRVGRRDISPKRSVETCQNCMVMNAIECITTQEQTSKPGGGGPVRLHLSGSPWPRSSAPVQSQPSTPCSGWFRSSGSDLAQLGTRGTGRGPGGADLVPVPHSVVFLERHTDASSVNLNREIPPSPVSSPGNTSTSLFTQRVCKELYKERQRAGIVLSFTLPGQQTHQGATVSLNSTSNPPSLSQTAEKLQNLRRKPKKSKEDLMKAVMNQSAGESKRLQDWREKIQQWRETESRRKELAKKKSTKQLMSLLAGQTECMQSLVAMQAEHYRAAPSTIPKLSPLCPNVSSKPPSPASRFLPPPAAPNTCTFTYQP
ncbi:uncharacterized protein LOC127038367 [Gopherus flavomarginatus]|uniref:uncharacterized protein LOC127038367 n=1 Tax=Gopherus flavomarginatus TaxID=286002 RepID=UPI0021CBF605|nr:uncharacterized protein LOC127038367 [Gopherus flavomarginatus]